MAVCVGPEIHCIASKWRRSRGSGRLIKGTGLARCQRIERLFFIDKWLLREDFVLEQKVNNQVTDAHRTQLFATAAASIEAALAHVGNKGIPSRWQLVWIERAILAFSTGLYIAAKQAINNMYMEKSNNYECYIKHMDVNTLHNRVKIVSYFNELKKAGAIQKPYFRHR